MPCRVVVPLVDAEHDRHIFVLGRCGDDDLFRARFQVPCGFGAFGELAGAFDHDIHAEVAPGQARQCGRGTQRDRLAVHQQVAPVRFHRAIERAIVRIVREQIGDHVMLRDVAHRHADHFKVGVVFVDRLEGLPSCASEAVEGDAGFCHR